jgi:hypothetical protein
MNKKANQRFFNDVCLYAYITCIDDLEALAEVSPLSLQQIELKKSI